ncbi:MAG: 30S ribosome-binding factor RbfA [Candidatus Margulisiibacteriota bacterium]
MSRADRVAELIKAEVSRIIREDVNDPRIGFVSITGVDVSPDLENARIRVSILGTEEVKQESMGGLRSASRFIRGKLGDLLELRLVPQISFIRDDSLEKGCRVLGIINQLEKKEHAKSRVPNQKGRKKS